MGSFSWLQSSSVSWLPQMLTGQRRMLPWLILLLPFSLASSPDSTITGQDFQSMILIAQDNIFLKIPE